MIKIETKTTYLCDGCLEEVKEKKDLTLFGENREICSKCIKYIVENGLKAGWFIPRSNCSVCGGSGETFNTIPYNYNWHTDKPIFSNYRSCSCGRQDLKIDKSKTCDCYHDQKPCTCEKI